ncbi:hypothetical protein [Anatilimnocola floriformis]|uniref:hypothetical protein n=1 Tax=Anatilimnocola floriformis TaxID=2948575 RepID=UPI0020C52A4A|nr:hypothetical protein [Anatilimnocola floriformis]
MSVPSCIWLRRVAAAASFALIVTVSTHAFAQAPTSGWKMPNLNPFASKTAAPANNGGRSTISKVVDPFGLIPGTGGKTTTASFGQQPSTLQKMTNGTKKAASQTADFLNPFNDGKPAARQESMTGANSVFNQQANRGKGQAEKKSWFPGWASPHVEDKDQSVNSFLARPKPQP